MLKWKRTVSVFLIVAVICNQLPVILSAQEDKAFPQNSETTETWSLEGYVSISNQAELEAIADDPAGKYYLTTDIALSGNWMPIAEFSGVLDGNGHCISGLTLTKTTKATDEDLELLGLVGQNSGALCNLTLSDASIEYTHGATTTDSSIGAIGFFAGVNAANGQIIGCNVDSSCTIDVTAYRAAFVGSIAGKNRESIKHCNNESTITVYADGSNVNVGGITGENNGFITNEILYCSNSGAVTVTAEVDNFPIAADIGGVCGESMGLLENCYNSAAVTGYIAGGGDVTLGGIVGSAFEVVRRAENDGVVTVKGGSLAYVGGIVGRMNGETLEYCRNSAMINIYGRVSEDKTSYTNATIGGIAGYATDIVRYCFNTGGLLSAADTAALRSLLAGFLIGEAGNATIEQCYSTMWRHSIGGASSWSCGGLVGLGYDSSLINCYFNKHLNSFQAVQVEYVRHCRQQSLRRLRQCSSLDHPGPQWHTRQWFQRSLHHPRYLQSNRECTRLVCRYSH